MYDVARGQYARMSPTSPRAYAPSQVSVCVIIVSIVLLFVWRPEWDYCDAAVARLVRIARKPSGGVSAEDLRSAMIQVVDELKSHGESLPAEKAFRIEFADPLNGADSSDAVSEASPFATVITVRLNGLC